MQSETRFKTKVLKALREIPNSWWVKIQQVSMRGTPDIIGCVNGHFVAWELKKSKFDHPDKLQQHNLDLITKSQSLARIVFPENFDHCLLEVRALVGLTDEIDTKKACDEIMKRHLR